MFIIHGVWFCVKGKKKKRIRELKKHRIKELRIKEVENCRMSMGEVVGKRCDLLFAIDEVVNCGGKVCKN